MQLGCNMNLVIRCLRVHAVLATVDVRQVVGLVLMLRHMTTATHVRSTHALAA